MLSITYVFGGARGVGRIARARKLFRLIGPLVDGGGYSFVACDDAARWPGGEGEPWVVGYRFGQVPDVGMLIRGEPPTVFVDAYPDGPAGVMAQLLPLIRARRPAAKLVLVVRDILDEPRRVIARLSHGGYALLTRY